MKFLLFLMLGALLLFLCWPVALLLLIAWPILFLLSIPFRIVGAVLEGVVVLIREIFLLPARVLGYRD